MKAFLPITRLGLYERINVDCASVKFRFPWYATEAVSLKAPVTRVLQEFQSVAYFCIELRLLNSSNTRHNFLSNPVDEARLVLTW